MNLQFDGEVWYWKGPAPWFFVTVPDGEAIEIRELASRVTYGWGMIPVDVRIGKTRYSTSLWPKDGSYVVPIKASVRKCERIQEGDTVAIQLDIGVTGLRA